MRTTSSSLVFFLLATTSAAVVVVYGACPITPLEEGSRCPWRTVANVDDPYVQGYGFFALQQAHLKFVKVERARAQAVGDCCNNIERYYELIVDAIQRDGGEVSKYRAVVYVKEKIPIKLVSLQSFHEPPPPPHAN